MVVGDENVMHDDGGYNKSYTSFRAAALSIFSA